LYLECCIFDSSKSNKNWRQQDKRGKHFMKTTIKRGSYNEILLISLSKTLNKQVINLFNEAAKADKVDEHGTWDLGANFDIKGRGSSLNWDLYAVGHDIHSKKLLIVVQLRQFVRRHKNYYPQIRKSYFLIGRNEDNHAFAHAVESRVIHSAISAGRDVVKAVQDWIFNCDYKKVIRQGDIALVPVTRVPAERVIKTKVMIEESHLLEADEYAVNGSLYALNPLMIHQPGTHATIQGAGWFRVAVGIRAGHWDFAAPTID